MYRDTIDAAMGNYPYPSSYILSGEGTLPAYPVRVACQHLGNEDLDGEELLSSMRRAIGVFYNATGKARCFDVGSGEDALRANEESEDFWSWQWCTEQFMPMTRDGKRDMFWDQPFDMEEAASLCEKKWGVRPQAERPTVSKICCVCFPFYSIFIDLFLVLIFSICFCFC